MTIAQDTPERIISAAVYNGQIISLPSPARHHDILWGLVGIEGTIPIQGFLTSTGRFVNRNEAIGVAWRAKQINSEKPSVKDHELFSEDLW
jgi:hypothetical protein